MGKRKKIILSTIKWTLISIGSLGLGGIIAFYIAIGCGACPDMQTMWVESAMLTFHHHYYAEWFVPQSVIDRIMSANVVDDSNVESKTEIDKPAPEPDIVTPEQLEKQEEEKYNAEGYTKLSSGVYLKEVTGSTKAGNFVGYLMLCVDPSRVKLVDTNRQFNCGATVAMMIEQHGAVAGINGGGFVDGPDYNSNGGTPYGIIIEDGIKVCPSGSYDSTFRIIGMNSDNVMVLKNGSAAWALENGLRCAVTAEAYLIVDGEGVDVGAWGVNPRTALGQRKTGEIIFLAVDGRQLGYSIGADLPSLRDILLEEGCVNAVTMDGGSSTVMEYATYTESGECNVELINKPNLGHTLDAQRYINNAWVIMPKETSDDVKTSSSGPAGSEDTQ